MREILQLSNRPTVIVAVHDAIAVRALEAIKEAGLRILEDMAVVSIADVAERAHTRPPLTSVRIPRAELGVLAMQRVHSLITGEPELAVKRSVYGELVVRVSCGASLLRQAEAPPVQP